MNMRIDIENKETKILSQYAALSKDSRGREVLEEKCSIRTDYQRDRDRILHSKAFRRLKHKTQVFIAPEGDHFRTRLTHTLEVSQVARTIGRALGLNEDLIEAIALGHDLGHTPFGHTGERVLARLHSQGFNHNEQSLRVVDLLEHRPGRNGLNLTFEVRDGILNHSGKNQPKTLEGKLVRWADGIAYINHDIDDAIRGGIISLEDIPRDILENLGLSHSERINRMILDLIENSYNKNEILMSEKINFYTNELRKFMFENVYLDGKAKSQEKKAEYVVEEMYKYYMESGDLPKSHLEIYKDIKGIEMEDIISDYIAGMTDRFVINKFKEIFVPQAWNKY